MTHLTEGGSVQPQVMAAREAFAPLPAETKHKVLDWINTTIAPATRVYPLNSYSIKHDAEAAIGTYLANDQFKGAMLACGYMPTPASAHETNWNFRIKSVIPAAERPPVGQRGFGGFLRRERTAKGMGLRELARRVGVSPAYLSKIETGQFQPPAEDKVVAIAKVLNLDSDVLLAEAGRVPTDVLEAIQRKPIAMAKLIRAAQDLGDAA